MRSAHPSLRPQAKQVRYSGLSAGIHTFVVKAKNETKTDTAEASWQIVSSPTGPSGLTVTSSIANGSTLSGAVSWQATANQTVSVVDFYIDSVPKWTEKIAPYVEWGFDHLVFHAPGEDQRRFLEQFAADVVPKLRERF